MREIVLDTETTGLSAKTGDRLVEIGCIELINHLPSGEVYHQYINPEVAMPREAQEVHGLSDEFLSDKPRFLEIVDAFLETPFSGGRHQRRIDKIMALEQGDVSPSDDSGRDS